MPETEANPDQFTMSFGDHLEELRRRIILAILPPLPISIVAFLFSGTLLDLITAPLVRVLQSFNLPDRLQTLGPAEAIVTSMKISILVGVIISAPWILWQGWKFIQPGLYAHERRFVYFLVPGSSILTVLGVLTLYYVMLPLFLTMLILFGLSLDRSGRTLVPTPLPDAVSYVGPIVPTLPGVPANPSPGMMWLTSENELRIAVPNSTNLARQLADGTLAPEDISPQDLIILRIPVARDTTLSQEFRLSTYVGFVLVLLLAMVIAFQTPLVILLLGWVGIVTPASLRAQRKKAILVLTVISAVITPAEPVSLVAMFIPLYLLFEFGILLLAIFPAKRVAEGFIGTSGPNKNSDSITPTRDERSMPRNDAIEPDSEHDSTDDGRQK